MVNKYKIMTIGQKTEDFHYCDGDYKFYSDVHRGSVSGRLMTGFSMANALRPDTKDVF